MIEVLADQGTREWHAARLGLPTASGFKNLVTTKTLKPAKWGRYLTTLVTEWALGEPLITDSSYAMDRGHQLEPEARDWLSSECGLAIHEVGFCLTDDRRYGASPDGLLDDGEGIAELKCRLDQNHMAVLLGNREDTILEYWQQIQGQLLVTGRKYCLLGFYHPTLPSVWYHIERNPLLIGALGGALDPFCEELAAAKLRFAEIQEEQRKNVHPGDDLFR